MNVAPRPFNTLSLCSGTAGLDIGLGMAVPHARTVCWVEWEAYAAGLLVQRMEEGALDEAPVWSDLRTFNGRPWRGIVDCITAGYPCQPFSCAGKRLGKHDPRHLWPYIRRILVQTRAPYLFCENVAGHISLGFDQVEADLHRLGYRVAACVVSASDVAASHQRKRLFFLAHREGGGRQVGSGRGIFQTGDAMENSERAESWQGEQGEQGEAGSRRRGPENAGGHLADADARRRRAQSDKKQPPVWPYRGISPLPAYPPGPGDLDGWRRVLEIDPTVEPAICRVADGNADQLDRHRRPRLRLCGNGVVADAAALAFAALVAQFDTGEMT